MKEKTFFSFPRFYLELKKDPHGPDVALFIGNLPANLSQKEYEKILGDFLQESRGAPSFSSVGPIYYEYGSMVVTFGNSEDAVIGYELLRVCSHEDKKLLGEGGGRSLRSRGTFRTISDLS